MSQYRGTKSETFKAKSTHRMETSNILASIMKIKCASWTGSVDDGKKKKKNPHKILLSAILVKPFGVYMNESDGDKLIGRDSAFLMSFSFPAA